MTSDKKDGATLIAAERLRQIEKEKWTPYHDQTEHRDGELALAACCYAMPEQLYTKVPTSCGFAFNDPWPWERRTDKRYDYSPKGGLPDPLKLTKAQRIHLLVKAGALIAAEIDRLQRTRPDR